MEEQFLDPLKHISELRGRAAGQLALISDQEALLRRLEGEPEELATAARNTLALMRATLEVMQDRLRIAEGEAVLFGAVRVPDAEGSEPTT